MYQIMKAHATPHCRLRQSQLQQRPDWPLFLASEYAQLDKYHKQNMFGKPVPYPKPTINDPAPLVLDFVWDYVMKLDPITLKESPKSRGTCNGSRLSGIAETFANCVDQTVH